ncbi:hypothetical protein BLOT_008477 [Blomia tropicalis]|nr:hypothetical protein BLOT_008477 [Blomia tropicalis]
MNPKDIKNLIFVYGTLKRSQPNYNVMTDQTNGEAKFVCTARTVESYPLVIASRYNIPFLLGKPGAGYQITGEIYSVDEKMMKFLDDFEGHPGFYTRLQRQVITEDGKTLMSWLYILEKFHSEMLNFPMIENYDSYGDHGRPYVERLARQGETTNSLDDILEN